MAMAMSDLPGELVTEILSRVPLTSLRALRCTCKTWEVLSKTHIVAKTDAEGTFLGFMVIDYNLYSMKLDLQGTRDNGNLVYRPSIERVWLLEQAEIWENLVPYSKSTILTQVHGEFLMSIPATAFGQRLILPFGAGVRFIKTVVLSRVRDEQLAVLHQPEDNNVMEFWITSKIEPNAASWTRFLRVEMTPQSFVTESFFIDEEKKLALVSGFFKLFRHIYKRAYIIREQGCIESVEMRKDREPGNKLVFSSYAPSLVQLQINR
ncbi:hypothetical protein HID58_011587 [Brassica napus]|uniref:F-box domain-containing protein n=1 Tax=Brassica napus TaxID=3708 RepID=A0ABQ8DYM0_BRANA|nr:hypothetical protein HID58_011587 [Brassica napus]